MSFRYCIEPAKSGRSKCSDTKCKEIINKEELRIGKISKNPFNDEGEMTKWYHAACMFSAQTRMRGSSKKVESTSDLENFEDLDDDQKAVVEELVAGGGKKATKSKGTKRKKAESDEDEDDESEDEKPKKKAKAEKKVTAKAEKKVTAKAKAKSRAKKSKKEESDEEEEGSDDEGSDDEGSAEDGAGAGEVQYYESDSSSGGKFWEIQRNGTKVTTRYGKVGATGQSNTKDWGTVDKAEKEVAKLVKEKTKKGYELATRD